MVHQSNGFRVAIVVNGNEQRILNGNVYVPFNTEYSVRVVNQNNIRGIVKLCIDGYEENERFIVNANDSITLSRFMCGNNNSGDSFLFVKKNDSRVTNKDSIHNGIVSVKCWKEQITRYVLPDNEPYVWPNDEFEPTPYRPYTPWGPYILRYWWSNNTPISTIYGGGGKTTGSSINLNNIQLTNTTTFSCNSSQEGATVGGSKNNQQFFNTDGFDTESFYTQLTIKLMGKN